MASRVLSTIICVSGVTVCISEDETIFYFGREKQGSIDEKTFLPPTKLPLLQQIHQIACGHGHTICLDVNGNVFTFGSNFSGQLGVGKDKEALNYSKEPIKLDLPPVIQISSNEKGSMCLTKEGLLYSFGANDYGQLGHGNNEESYISPTLIKSLKDIEFVECGSDYTICKCLNNDIYAWGMNDLGELGIGNDNNQNSPVKCIDWPDDIVDIKCGGSHTLVLTNTQEVYSCGSNYSGELGIGELTDNENFLTKLQKNENLVDIIRIGCGDNHSMCIDASGNMWVFGDNNSGQLGLGEEVATQFIPAKIPSLSNIIDISTRGCHVFVKTSNNEIYAFGHNYSLELGKETEEDCQLTPIQVFQGREDIWRSNINRSKSKSARF